MVRHCLKMCATPGAWMNETGLLSSAAVVPHKVNLSSCVVNLPSCVARRPLCHKVKSTLTWSSVAPFYHDLRYFRHRTNEHLARVTQRLFSINICSEKQILTKIFYYLRSDKNCSVTVQLMYNFRSPPNKFPTIFWSLISSHLGSITSRCSGKWARTHPLKERLDACDFLCSFKPIMLPSADFRLAKIVAEIITSKQKQGHPTTISF